MEESSFKDRLIDELNYRGISNKEFAKKVGISSGTLGMYLYRGSIPSADIAVRMASVLNSSVEYLVIGKESGEKISQNDSKKQWQIREIANIVKSLSDSQLEHFLFITREFKAAVTKE